MSTDRRPMRLRRPLLDHSVGYYVDAAWTAGADGARWFTSYSDEAAAAHLLGRAQRIAAAVPQGIRNVELTCSEGMLAWILGRILNLDPPSGRPELIIDVTGVGAVLADAIVRLDDGGILLAADHDPTAALLLDPYPDVHSRGLHLIGISPTIVEADGDYSKASPDVASLVERLHQIPEGASPEHGSLWFRVQPEDRTTSEP